MRCYAEYLEYFSKSSERMAKKMECEVPNGEMPDIKSYNNIIGK